MVGEILIILCLIVILYGIISLIVNISKRRRQEDNLGMYEALGASTSRPSTNVNPDFQNSKWKKEGDKKREQYHKKNPTKPLNFNKSQPKQKRTYGARSNERNTSSEPSLVSIFPSDNYTPIDDYSSSSSDNDSHSSFEGFGGGGSFGGVVLQVLGVIHHLVVTLVPQIVEV